MIVESQPRASRDHSRLLPWVVLIVVAVGLPGFWLPTKSMVLCDDDPRYPQFDHFYGLAEQALWAALALVIIGVATLFTRRRGALWSWVRWAVLVGALGAVALNAWAGVEAGHKGGEIFHSESCNEPNVPIEVPDGMIARYLGVGAPW